MYFTTESAQRAHLVLPAAGWGEKVGTFINSERRIGLVKKVSRAPGRALSDFNIFKLVAQYWGCGKMFEKWSSPESVFQILKELSRGQPCEITGIRDYPDHVYVEMNPLDAELLGIEANQKVLVASKRAEVTAKAFLTSTVQAGQLFIPMHYAVTNELTFPAVDPYSRQPAYKACAVSVRPWREPGTQPG